jgi:hypothetical protein
MCFRFLYNCCLKNFSFWEEFREVWLKIYIDLYVQYPLFWSDFNKTLIFSTDFRKLLKHQISWKSVQAGRRKDGQTDVMKLIVTLRNFANAWSKDSDPTAQSTLSVLTENQSLNSVGKYRVFLEPYETNEYFGCNTTTRNWTASHLNIITPLLPPPPPQIQDSTFRRKVHAYSFLGLQVSHSLGVRGHCVKMNSESSLKRVKGLKERINRVCLGEKKGDIPSTWWRQTPQWRWYYSGDTRHRIRSCSTPSLQPDLTPTDFWLFPALKKPLKGIHVTRD